MDKRKADLFAKQVAIAAYKETLKKLAQHYDRTKNTGGEILYDGEKGVNKMQYEMEVPPFTETEHSLLQERNNPPRAKNNPEYNAWFKEHGGNAFQDTGLEGDPLSGLADDVGYAKDKCSECGCEKKHDKKEEKKAAVYNDLMKLAKHYEKALKKK